MEAAVVLSKFRLSLFFASMLAVSACELSEEVSANHLERGKAFFHKGEYDKALLELKTSAQGNNVGSETYYYMALLDEKKSNFKAMRDHLSKAIDINPDDINARQKMGKVSLLFGDLQKAMEQAEYLLKKDQNNAEARLILASIYYKQGKKEQAIDVVDSLLKANGNNIDALSLKAAYFYEKSRFNEALAVINSAIKVDEKNLSIRLFRIKILASLNKVQDVVDEYKSLISIFPGVDKFKADLASIYSMLNKVDLAEELLRGIVSNSDKLEPKVALLDFLKAKNKEHLVEAFDSMLEKTGKRPKQMFVLSEWMLEAGYVKQAEAGFRKLAELSDENEKMELVARTKLAEIAFRDKEYEKSEMILSEVLAIDSSFFEANLLKARQLLVQNQVDQAVDLLNKLVWAKKGGDKVYVLLAQAYYQKKDVAQYEKFLKEALKVRPSNIQAFLPVYAYYIKVNQKEMARDLVDKALKEKPNQEVFLASKAELDISESRWDDAQEVVKKLMLFSKQKVVPLYLQANVYQGTQKYENAIKIYRKILLEHPEHLDSLMNLVKSYEAMGQQDKVKGFLEDYQAKHEESIAIMGVLVDYYVATKDYDKARQLLLSQIKQVPEHDASIYLALAKVEYTATKNPDAAKNIYIRALRDYPRNLRLSLALAGLYEQTGNRSAARKIYEEVLENNPDEVLAINNLAAILLESDENGSAAKGLALVERFKASGNIFFQDTYAWALLKNGKTNEGLAVLEALILQEPDFPVFRYHLGVAHSMAGNKATAIVELKKSIALSERQKGFFVDRDKALKLLEKLERQ